MIHEREKTLSDLRKRLRLVNQAIQTLETLARTEQQQQQTEASAQELSGRPSSGSNWASARQNSAQHRKRGGEQTQR